MARNYSGPVQASPARATHSTMEYNTLSRTSLNTGYHGHGQNGPASPGRPFNDQGYHGPVRNGSFHNNTPQGGHRVSVRNHRPNSYQKPILATSAAWRQWPQVKVKILGIPSDCKPSEIFRLLKGKGAIDYIEVRSENSDYGLRRVALVTFMPPPDAAFWDQEDIGSIRQTGRLIRAELVAQHAPECKSPNDPEVVFPETMSVPANKLEFGFLSAETLPVLPSQMSVMRSVSAVRSGAISLTLNLKFEELIVYFAVNLSDLGETGHGRTASPLHSADTLTPRIASSPSKVPLVGEWKFIIKFKQMDYIYLREGDPNRKELVIPARSPPKWFRKVSDPTTTMSDTDNRWSSRQAWLRQTDIYAEQDALRLLNSSLNLHKDTPFIDIGAWTTYRLNFPIYALNDGTGAMLLRALDEFNVRCHCNNKLVLERDLSTKAAAWDFLDGPTASLTARSSYNDMSPDSIHLEWNVRYQLEVCISNGILSPFDLTKSFFERLQGLQVREAIRRLEYIADKEARLSEPMSMFTTRVPRKTQSRIPSYCTLQRSVTVTPSQIIYSSPTVEMSNRIIRQYPEYADRFLRVRFSDEKGKIFHSEDETNDPLFNRVHRCLANGITIGGRHYEYLASGNSQFKEHGAYFFAAKDGHSAATIREWMGDFRNLKVVAKYNSRMGQCYSTTRAITSINELKLIEIFDVEISDKKVVFTDGVGKISQFLAQMIAIDLKIAGDTPSAFQFRLGGCKGVLAVWPGVDNKEVHIRPSQYKFPSNHEGLEIVRHSEYQEAQLNRQLITNLGCLGVPDKVFVQKMQAELDGIERAMSNDREAIKLLQDRVDPNQMTSMIASLLEAGLLRAGDPFTISVLQLWRAWRYKTLKEKANITVKKSAFVIGVTDETQSLRGHFDSQSSTGFSYDDPVNSLPEIFLQINDREHPGNYRVIQGVCCLMRNPSLHPGDVRIVHAVDVPALRHLRNVVVFPQIGDRDIPSMCSGGDLDGDDYYVAWDESLLPKEWNHEPMLQPNNPGPKEVNSVSVTDIINFHVNFMKQDSLGKIATAWLALADQALGGPKHPGCVRLAQEHSTAVDFAKSGHPPNAKLIQEVGPRLYPHYMERKTNSRTSETACGKLYDMVQKIDFVPNLGNAFDKRILEYYEHIPKEVLAAAREIKEDYDTSIRRIMRQWEIATEFEIWTAFILDHSKLAKAYEIQTEIGRLSTALKSQFRDECIRAAGGESMDTLGPFAVAMYQITEYQTAQALREHEWEHESNPCGIPPMVPKDTPFISFPWLCHRELCKIARHGKPASSTSSSAVRTKSEEHFRDGGTPRAAPDSVDAPVGTTESGEVPVVIHDQRVTAAPKGHALWRGSLLTRPLAASDPDHLDYDDEFHDTKEMQPPYKPALTSRRDAQGGLGSVGVSVVKTPDILDLNPLEVLPPTLENMSINDATLEKRNQRHTDQQQKTLSQTPASSKASKAVLRESSKRPPNETSILDKSDSEADEYESDDDESDNGVEKQQSKGSRNRDAFGQLSALYTASPVINANSRGAHNTTVKPNSSPGSSATASARASSDTESD